MEITGFISVTLEEQEDMAHINDNLEDASSFRGGFAKFNLRK